MNWFQKQWQRFKEKSWRGKLSDLVFIFILVAMLTPTGRVWFQRGILATGVFSNIEVNEGTQVSAANWELNFADLNGQPVTLSDFRGAPIFLNFWATWCPPCNAEMPSIIEMMETYDGEARFILVTSEAPETVAKYLQSKGWNLPVYILQSYPTAELEYSSLPTSIVIDAEGKVVHRSEGMRKWSAESLQSLLATDPS